MGSAAAPARRGRGVLLRGTRRRAACGRRAPRRRRRGLHGRLLHREDGLLGLRLLHEELLLLHGDHHLLPARERLAPHKPMAFANAEPIDEPSHFVQVIIP